MSLQNNSIGQAMIEYLLLLVFLMTLTLKMVGGFTDFMQGTIGNLGHVLSYNLSVGVCPEQCFYGSYQNGYRAK